MASKRRRGRSGKGKARSGLLTREQQRDLLGVGLVALALFVAAALTPVEWLGEGAAGRFSSGNVVGAIGVFLRRLAVGAFGVGAPVFPLLLLVGGLRALEWVSRAWALRIAALALGLLVLAPTFIAILRPGSTWAGSLGAALGNALREGVGVIGGLLLVGVVFTGLCVLVLRWNPLRSLGTGVVKGSELAVRGAKAVRESYRDRREAWAERAADEGGRLPEEKWTGPETGEDPPPEGPEGGALAGAPSNGKAAALAPPAAPPASSPRPTAGDLPDPADPRDLEGGELPDLSLLTPEQTADRASMVRELEALGAVLVDKLATFNVQCTLGGRTTGPVVTQYEVIPAPGVKVNRIANLDADLALAMKAQSIRIVAPIPGKGAVGVEIPNPEPAIVQLRDILEAREYSKARGTLPLGLGKDLTGRPYVADLARMPHLLIAGATGSGKSVCINTIVTSLIYRHTPERLRLLMIDPKMVELSAYAELPHLRHPVITDPADAAAVLKWAVLEMERRYQLLADLRVRSLAEYNRRLRRRKGEAAAAGGEGDGSAQTLEHRGPLPYIVVVIDELADLMMQVQSEVERPLAQLAQKARAIGIHLIVATQRPSVNVITGLIKANFPTRIAFRVASKTDSRTILDQNGAEALLGNGDMLFLPPGESEPVRIQGAYLSTDDTDRLIGWYRERSARAEADGEPFLAPAFAEPDILEELREHERMDEGMTDGISGEWDDLFRDAAEVCIQNQGGSTSLLQRRLSIGYGRAARIVDQLEEAGIVGPQDGSRPREVLVTLDELDQMFGSGA